MSLPNAQSRIEVSPDQLPMHCPTPDTPLWNSHPRVFIPLGDSPDGTATCEYCGTEFVLIVAPGGASTDAERPPMKDGVPPGTG